MARTFSAEDFSPKQVTGVFRDQWPRWLCDSIIRASQPVSRSDAYGALPHSHFIEDDVSLASDLVAIEVSCSVFDLIIREFSKDHTFVDRNLKQRKGRFTTLIPVSKQKRGPTRIPISWDHAKPWYHRVAE